MISAWAIGEVSCKNVKMNRIQIIDSVMRGLDNEALGRYFHMINTIEGVHGKKVFNKK